MKSKKYLLILIFSLSIIISAYPQPIGWVNDFAGVIEEPYENRITNLIEEIEKNTSIEIAVVTVQSLEGDTIEKYAVKLFEEWGIGKENKDNGLLILAAIEDREWRIEVGYGLEPIINDAKAGRIGRNYLSPNFKEQKYGEGFYQAVKAIDKEIEEEKTIISEEKINWFPILLISIASFILLILLLKSFLKSSSKKWDDDFLALAAISSINSKNLGSINSFGGFGGGFSGGGGGSGSW